MELFDSHAHYDDDKFNEDRDEIIKQIYEFGITQCINAGYTLSSSKAANEIAQKYEFIYSTAGISPTEPFSENILEEIKQIEEIAKKDKVVAIGEIGLDYFWNKDNKEQQKEIFIKQIEIANRLNLPIVIHTREAIQDTMEILKANKVLNAGVIHCCPLNKDLITNALKAGFYISFAGPVTFKNSKNANEMISIVPIERILIETDSPYLSPEPYRGTRNDSRKVKYIAEKIAEVKKIDIAEVAKITYQNAKTIFKI